MVDPFYLKSQHVLGLQIGALLDSCNYIFNAGWLRILLKNENESNAILLLGHSPLIINKNSIRIKIKKFQNGICRKEASCNVFVYK